MERNTLVTLIIGTRGSVHTLAIPGGAFRQAAKGRVVTLTPYGMPGAQLYREGQEFKVIETRENILPDGSIEYVRIDYPIVKAE